MKHQDDPRVRRLVFVQETGGLGDAWMEARAEFGCVMHEPGVLL